MDKFTPGPWRYAPTNGGHMIAGGRPGYLAEVRDCGSGDVDANARLIAAAPDLLEALKLAHEHLMTLYPTGMTDDYLVKTVNAAIAKAEGK